MAESFYPRIIREFEDDDDPMVYDKRGRQALGAWHGSEIQRS